MFQRHFLNVCWTLFSWYLAARQLQGLRLPYHNGVEYTKSMVHVTWHVLFTSGEPIRSSALYGAIVFNTLAEPCSKHAASLDNGRGHLLFMLSMVFVVLIHSKAFLSQTAANTA